MQQEQSEHQAVHVYGQSDMTAYTRTMATREVVFTCVRCQHEQCEWRYPGPAPKYCPSCRQQVAEEREELRVQRQREKRQAEAVQRRQKRNA
jgi:hypothetical protein